MFVRRVNENDVEDGMWALHAAIRRRGPARLLWITQAGAKAEHGTVRRLADGLYRGFHGQLGEYGSATVFRADLWISLLRAAERVMADERAPSARPGWWRRLLESGERRRARAA